MTPEKVQALAFQTDLVVEDIQGFLETHAASGLFTTDNFNDIWSKYSVKSTQRKRKTAEAGLLSYGALCLMANSQRSDYAIRIRSTHQLASRVSTWSWCPEKH